MISVSLIPHSWYTIEENINDKLYTHVTPTYTDDDQSSVLYKIIKVDPGNYTGADEQ